MMLSIVDTGHAISAAFALVVLLFGLLGLFPRWYTITIECEDAEQTTVDLHMYLYRGVCSGGNCFPYFDDQLKQDLPELYQDRQVFTAARGLATLACCCLGLSALMNLRAATWLAVHMKARVLGFWFGGIALVSFFSALVVVAASDAYKTSSYDGDDNSLCYLTDKVSRSAPQQGMSFTVVALMFTILYLVVHAIAVPAALKSAAGATTASRDWKQQESGGTDDGDQDKADAISVGQRSERGMEHFSLEVAGHEDETVMQARVSRFITRHRRMLLLALAALVLFLSVGNFIFVDDSIDGWLDSAFTVCGKNDRQYSSWKTTDRTGGTEAFRGFYLFNVTNPKEFLEGESAKVVETGPYSFRVHSTKYDVDFKNNQETVEYREFLKFFYRKARSCPGCNYKEDAIYTPNLIYSKLLRQGTNEATLFLGGECTTTQIGISLANPAVPLCTDEQRGDESVTTCGCCSYATGGCYDLAHPRNNNTLGSAISWLAEYDGGVKMEDSSTDLAFSNEIYSAVLVARSPRDILFGGGSAVAGFFQARDAINNPNTTTNNLTEIALYTHDLRALCEDVCASELDSLDFTRAQTDTAYLLDFLGGLDCNEVAPSTNDPDLYYLEATLSVLEGVQPPCCLYSGEVANLSLSSAAGIGCVSEIPGAVIDRRNKNVQQERATVNDTHNGLYTGCKADADYPAYTYSRFEDTYDELPGYYTPDTYTFPDMSYADPNYIDDVEDGTESTQTMIDVNEPSGEGLDPLGITAGFHNYQFSDGSPINETLNLFGKSTRRVMNFDYEGNTMLYGRFLVNKYLVNVNKTLALTESNQRQGMGVPDAGVVSLAYERFAPGFVSLPFFAQGGSDMLSQLDNTDRQAADGNGVYLYRSRYLYSNANSIFSRGSPGNYTKPMTIEEANAEDQYRATVFFDPALGRPIGGARRVQASFGTWNCNPALSSTCLLGMTADATVASCYSTTYLALTGLTRYSGCSAANVITPQTHGGKLLPIFWVSEQQRMSAEQQADYTRLHNFRSFANTTVIVGPIVALLLVLLAFSYHVGCLGQDDRRGSTAAEYDRAAASTPKDGPSMQDMEEDVTIPEADDTPQL